MKTGEPETDKVIACPACRESVAVAMEMMGRKVECPFCQHHFVAAETPLDTAAVTAELAGLEGQRRENVSQITELRGHVSRLNMELHRHELRMKSLAERQVELDASIASVRKKLDTK